MICQKHYLKKNNHSKSLRIVFAGTPDFAAQHLRMLINSHHKIIAIITKSDKNTKQNRTFNESPIKKIAIQNNIKLLQPKTLNTETIKKSIQNLHADIMIVVAYGLIIPKEILHIFPMGCINVHASLLPRWRGAAPIQWAILKGDKRTGISIILMNNKIDSGPIIYSKSCIINHTDTTICLYQRLALIGSKGILRTLKNILTKKTILKKQNEKKTTYANKITKQQGRINWFLEATIIERQIRAFYTWPSSYFLLNKTFIKIWEATIFPNKTNNATPGTIILVNKIGIQVNTGRGIIILKKIQFPGKKILNVYDIINAYQPLFKNGNILK